MSVLKSIFGALIGAAAGTGVYFAIQQVNGETYNWLPIVTGILTGMVASVFGGSSRTTSARFACGAFAALVAGIAIFGIEFLSTMTGVEETGEFGPLPARSTDRVVVAEKDAEAENETDDVEDGADEESGDSATGETSDATTDGDANANAARRDRSNPGITAEEANPGGGSEKARRVIDRIKKKRQWDNWMPYVFSGIGMLLAYQLARGFGSGPKNEGGG